MRGERGEGQDQKASGDYIYGLTSQALTCRTDQEAENRHSCAE